MPTRRNLLHLFAAAGAYSLMPALTLAAAPGNRRLVVVILRGAMDGLDVVRPHGDPDFARLRPNAEGTIDLDGFYGLHPALKPVEAMFRSRELAFVHATATPYRERSHFEGQDILERGIDRNDPSQSGWLNRLIGHFGGRSADLAVDIGDDIVLDGPNPHGNWFPDLTLNLTGESAQFLQALYKGDPILEPSFAEIQQMTGGDLGVPNLDPGVSPRELAGLAAKFLNQEARIAVFSMTGWDTHVNQAPRMAKQLAQLSAMLLKLRDDLGGNWQNTAVAMLSEFGRTAHLNGTAGTDHGTAGLTLLAGGLLANGKGGQVHAAKWPGLGEAQLYQERDLQPTDDVRRYPAWLAARMFGLEPAALARSVFLGLELGSDPGII